MSGASIEPVSWGTLRRWARRQRGEVASCPVAAGRTPRPEEAAGLEAAVPVRLAEFAAGRQAARVALTRLGVPPAVLPKRPDGTAEWPCGTTGSITHSRSFAAALVLHRSVALGCGIDVEEVPAELDPAVDDLILGPGDQDVLGGRDRIRTVILALSLKESVGKALYGGRGLFPDPLELSFRRTPAGGTVSVAGLTGPVQAALAGLRLEILALTGPITVTACVAVPGWGDVASG